MTSVIAVLGAPPERYPLWQWLPGIDLRLILDEPAPRALGIPAEHVVVSGTQSRSMSLGALIEQMCAQRLPDRIVHLQAADAQRVAAARTLHGLEGQQLAFAALVNDRVVLRESLHRAGIPLTAYRPVSRPADLRALAGAHGFPIRVRARFAQAPWPEALLSSPGEMNAWIEHGYPDAPEGWIAEPAGDEPYLRIDALCRDLPPELVWVAEHEQVADAHLTLALTPDDPRAETARRLLGAALGDLPHPAVGLVHAVLRTGREGLELADLGTGIDPRFPRSLMTDGLGVDPVRRYVQASAGLLLPPAADRLQCLSGRIAIPTRRPRTGHPALPERFAGPGTSAHLPEPRPRNRGGRDEAWFEVSGQDHAAVRGELLAFADWFAAATHRRPEANAA